MKEGEVYRDKGVCKDASYWAIETTRTHIKTNNNRDLHRSSHSLRLSTWEDVIEWFATEDRVKCIEWYSWVGTPIEDIAKEAAYKKNEFNCTALYFDKKHSRFLEYMDQIFVKKIMVWKYMDKIYSY